MGGKFDDSDFSSMGYHMPYVGEVYSRSIMTVGRSGVAFPVPKNNAKLKVSVALPHQAGLTKGAP